MISCSGVHCFTATPINPRGCWATEGDPYDHPPSSLPSSTILPQAGLSFDVEQPHAECGGAPTSLGSGSHCGSSVRLGNPCGSSVTRGYACHIPPPCQSFATLSCEGMGTPGNTSLQTMPQPLSPPPSTAALHDPVNESALLRVYVSRVNATPKHICLAGLFASLRLVDMLRATFHKAEPMADGTYVVLVVSSFSKDGAPIDVYVPAIGFMGPMTWAQEHVESLAGKPFVLEAFTSTRARMLGGSNTRSP